MTFNRNKVPALLCIIASAAISFVLLYWAVGEFF
jgi:hypothetical protein